jgi:hypothetical protein
MIAYFSASLLSAGPVLGSRPVGRSGGDILYIRIQFMVTSRTPCILHLTPPVGSNQRRSLVFKRILLGGGASGALVAAYFVGSLTVGGALAQTSPTPASPTTTQPAATEKETKPDTANEAEAGETGGAADGPETPGAAEGPETAD